MSAFSQLSYSSDTRKAIPSLYLLSDRESTKEFPPVKYASLHRNLVKSVNEFEE